MPLYKKYGLPLKVANKILLLIYFVFERTFSAALLKILTPPLAVLYVEILLSHFMDSFHIIYSQVSFSDRFENLASS